MSVALIAGAGAPISSASTAVGVNGIGGGVIGNTLQGWVWEGATERLNLGYSDTPFWLDNSINNGKKALESLLARTPDVDRLIGVSQAALVIIAALKDTPGIVPESGLTVYLIGNPARARTGVSDRYEGGYVPIVGLTHGGPVPQDIPGLRVFDVSFEYDGFADSPDPTNLLAVLNAFVGASVLHPYYANVDMADPNLLVRQIGNTTQYLVPVSRLPLLSPLYGIGLGAIASALEPLLRSIIDPAHDREGYVTQGSLEQARSVETPAAAVVPDSVQAALRGTQLHAGRESPAAFLLTAPGGNAESPANSEEAPDAQQLAIRGTEVFEAPDIDTKPGYDQEDQTDKAGKVENTEELAKRDDVAKTDEPGKANKRPKLQKTRTVKESASARRHTTSGSRSAGNDDSSAQ